MLTLDGRHLVLAVAFLILAGSVGRAQTQAGPKQPQSPNPDLSGEQLFKSYCATCHGADAKGHGPMGAQLTVPPPDLTVLSKSNSGKFPADRVAVVLKNGVNMPAHGTAEMPIWGSVFVDLKTRRTVTVRVTDLISYIESVQVK